MGLSRVALLGSMEEKIRWAKVAGSRWGQRLLGDQEISGRLFRLGNEIACSRTAMRAAGVTETCRICDEAEGGSCCGAGLENQYDGHLLLINLLMGVELPEVRRDPKSCFFLGTDGCVLAARHVICINYLCKKITDEVKPAALHSLREAEGVELYSLFRLQERIKQMLKEGARD